MTEHERSYASAQVLPTAFNTLTLFPTSHWSWHLVEPVWSDSACATPEHRRLAWSGWLERTYTRSAEEDSAVRAGPSCPKPFRVSVSVAHSLMPRANPGSLYRCGKST